MDNFKDEITNTTEQIKSKINKNEVLTELDLKSLLIEVLYEEDCHESK